MPLSVQEQLEVASNAWTTGDFDLMSKLLVAPDAVSIADQASVASKLGVKGDFLGAITDLALDPTVWIAAFLSRRFSTSQYLKGAIPERLVGTSAEFSGISSMGRTVEGFFRGTNVPKLLALKMKREAEVIQIGNKVFDKMIIRPNWKEEMPIVSQLLEGQNPVGATSELKGLASTIRTHMNEMWGFLSRTQKVEGGFDKIGGVTKAVSRDFTTGEAPRYLRDYLPHIPLISNESTMTISGKEALQRMGMGSMKQAFEITGENPAALWTATASDRLSSNYANFQRFMEKVGSQVFNPRLFRRVRMGIPLQSIEGQGLFVTDLNLILQKYFHSVARTYSLNAPLTEAERRLIQTRVIGEGGLTRTLPVSKAPIAVQIINEGLGAAGVGKARLVRKQIAGTDKFLEYINEADLNRPTLGALRTLVKEVRGQADEAEALFGNLFNSARWKLFGSRFGSKKEAQIEEAIASVQRDAKGRDATRRLTSFFYATTLGLNPASAFKNLFQPMLTTAPSIGIGPTLQGYKVLKSRLPIYAKNFRRQHQALRGNRDIPLIKRLNLAQERSFQETFPELASTGIKADPRAFEMSQAEALESALRGRAPFQTSDEFFKFLLQPFTQTELSNQIVTFYGAKAGLRQMVQRGFFQAPEGAVIDDFLNLEASNIVGSTQFRPGPGSRTVLQTLIPAPFRMFTSFPIRLANHFVDSTVRGAMTKSQLQNANLLEKLTGGRNLGTLARTYLMGKIAVKGAREALGVDIADAMGITGPYTGLVESGRMFSPLTFSPLPSMVMGIASFTSTRDIRKLNPLSLPGIGDVPVPKTLVPGGVFISRATKALRSFRPDLGGFVDDDERLMFRGDTMDAVLAMLGIPLEKERRMREAIDRVEANRLRVRQYRRRYSVAARNFDYPEMGKLQRIFQKEFPEIGRIGVTHQDQRRYNEMAQITSVQRMLSTAGRKMSYLEKDIYEMEPDLIAEPQFQGIGP